MIVTPRLAFESVMGDLNGDLGGIAVGLSYYRIQDVQALVSCIVVSELLWQLINTRADHR